MGSGRKAGPKRIDPETFAPAVWVCENDTAAFLVCQRRWAQLRPVVGGPPEAVTTAEALVHGAAIRMIPNIEVLFGLRLTEGIWRQINPLEHGISKRAAQVALAEAWHGVRISVDLATKTANLGADGVAWRKYKKGVRIRNIAAAMHWDKWNKEGVPVADRAAILTASGFPCTASQLARFAEERGL